MATTPAANVHKGTSKVLISTAISVAKNFGGYRPVGIVIPTGWTAGAIAFSVSDDNQTYWDLYDDGGGAAVSAQVRFLPVVNTLMLLSPRLFVATPWVKVKSIVSLADPSVNNQAAERIVTWFAAPLM